MPDEGVRILGLIELSHDAEHRVHDIQGRVHSALRGEQSDPLVGIGRYLRRRGITARIGRDSSARLGRHRWVVERTIGWLLSYKRLAPRYDRTAATITALARLG